jgi:hypothetical protein
MLDALDAARIAIEPTPIWDALIAEYQPTLRAVDLAAVEAQADTEAAIGGVW